MLFSWSVVELSSRTRWHLFVWAMERIPGHVWCGWRFIVYLHKRGVRWWVDDSASDLGSFLRSLFEHFYGYLISCSRVLFIFCWSARLGIFIPFSSILCVRGRNTSWKINLCGEKVWAWNGKEPSWIFGFVLGGSNAWARKHVCSCIIHLILLFWYHLW